MTILKFGLRLTIIFSFLLQQSCVEVPAEVTLDTPITLNEKDVQKIAKDIHDRLSQLDLRPPGHQDGPQWVNEADCSKAFNTWLDAQFANSLIPKRVITSLEYAAKNTSPLIHQCRDVDLNVEYTESVRQAVNSDDNRQSAVHFNLENFRNAIASKECSKNVLDPEKKKLIIKNLGMFVITNSLNVASPVYNIYYSTKKILDSDLTTVDAQKTLVNNGLLKFCSRSSPVPSHLTGTWAIKINDNQNEFDEARTKLGSLDTDIIAIPDIIGRHIEVKTIGGKDYFLLPKGEMSFYITIDLAVKAEIADALCALRVYKEDARKLDEERRKKAALK